MIRLFTIALTISCVLGSCATSLDSGGDPLDTFDDAGGAPIGGPGWNRPPDSHP